MSKQTFQAWLDDQSYYVARSEYENAQDRHDVSVKLPSGITIKWNDDGVEQIPTRDIRYGNWSDK